MKKALITGITGQDGSYLARLLLQKGYEVHGIKRRASSFNTSRINDIYEDTHQVNPKFFLHYGDLTDSLNVIKIIQDIQPDEIYNLAAQSHVGVSFQMQEYTANVDALGTLRILEAVKTLGLINQTRIYHASTSELFGKVKEIPQNEKTPFYPRSPYAVAKVYAYWISVNYREAYGMYISNGILFNHESPVRGETFVTQKIAMGVANIYLGKQDCIYLGNLDAQRDWGHAKEYVVGMWKILQHFEGDDFVLATGRTETIRKFVELAFNEVGTTITWEGKGVNEIGYNDKTGDILIKIDPKYFRPSEVDLLIGDSSKAKNLLNWEAKICLEELVSEMISEALYKAKLEVTDIKMNLN